MDQITDATIEEIEQEMSGDGVWIDPAFARSHDISAADEAAIVDAVAASPTADVKVVLVDIDHDDPRFQGDFTSLSAWLIDDLGGDATYVGWTGSEPALSIQSYGNQPDTTSVANVVNHEQPGDVVAQVLRVPELIQEGNAEQLWSEVPRDERYSWTADDGIQPGELLAGLGTAAVLIAVVAAAWRRRRRRGPRRPGGFTLPRSVLHTVRAAEDKRLRQQADDEVLALGEAIGAGEPGEAPAALQAWQQALDHYAAARAIVSQTAAPADIVGALVLARRGQSARAVAQRDEPTPWRPTPGCWFNPLHTRNSVGTTTTSTTGAGTDTGTGHAAGFATVTWRYAGREVDVPACGACAAAIAAGREPEDILDFIEGEQTVHYFHLDLGAWSRTGYGSLDPDLLGALLVDRGRGR